MPPVVPQLAPTARQVLLTQHPVLQTSAAQHCWPGAPQGKQLPPTQTAPLAQVLPSQHAWVGAPQAAPSGALPALPLAPALPELPESPPVPALASLVPPVPLE